MKLRHGGLAALAVLALSLPGLRASAQTEDAGDEQPAEKAKPAKAPEAAPPAEPSEIAPSPPPAPVGAQGYVPLAPSPAPLRVENSSASIQFGILAQPAFEMAGAADADLTTKNIYLRRFRFIVGGTLFKSFEYFLQLDYPNLFKLDPGDTMAIDKNAPGLNIQDAFVTFKMLGDQIKIDAGFMLPPLSHNSLESAAKLYGHDFFANTFRRNLFGIADPFKSDGESPIGRDAGVQVRALVLNGHIDVRAGAFMGHRVGLVPAAGADPSLVGGLNMVRLAGRLQINLLDAEPGFFYQGTYNGSKKVVSIGGFYDFQTHTSTRQDSGTYKYFGADLLVDLPLGPGVLTLQGNAVQWDGGTFIMVLPKDKAFMGELGYLIGPIMLSPIVRVERLVSPEIPSNDPMMPPNIPNPLNPSEDRYGGGLAFWPYGHNSNVKLFVARVHRTVGIHDFNVINLQWQVFYF